MVNSKDISRAFIGLELYMLAWVAWDAWHEDIRFHSVFTLTRLIIAGMLMVINAFFFRPNKGRGWALFEGWGGVVLTIFSLYKLLS